MYGASKPEPKKRKSHTSCKSHRRVERRTDSSESSDDAQALSVATKTKSKVTSGKSMSQSKKASTPRGTTSDAKKQVSKSAARSEPSGRGPEPRPDNKLITKWKDFLRKVDEFVHPTLRADFIRVAAPSYRFLLDENRRRNKYSRYAGTHKPGFVGTRAYCSLCNIISQNAASHVQHTVTLIRHRLPFKMLHMGIFLLMGQHDPTPSNEMCDYVIDLVEDIVREYKASGKRGFKYEPTNSWAIWYRMWEKDRDGATELNEFERRSQWVRLVEKNEGQKLHRQTPFHDRRDRSPNRVYPSRSPDSPWILVRGGVQSQGFQSPDVRGRHPQRRSSTSSVRSETISTHRVQSPIDDEYLFPPSTSSKKKRVPPTATVTSASSASKSRPPVALSPVTARGESVASRDPSPAQKSQLKGQQVTASTSAKSTKPKPSATYTPAAAAAVPTAKRSADELKGPSRASTDPKPSTSGAVVKRPKLDGDRDNTCAPTTSKPAASKETRTTSRPDDRQDRRSDGNKERKTGDAKDKKSDERKDKKPGPRDESPDPKQRPSTRF